MSQRAASPPIADLCRACLTERGRSAASLLLRELAQNPVLGLIKIGEERRVRIVHAPEPHLQEPLADIRPVLVLQTHQHSNKEAFVEHELALLIIAARSDLYGL